MFGLPTAGKPLIKAYQKQLLKKMSLKPYHRLKITAITIVKFYFNDEFVKPVFTITDLVIILLNLHLNIVFFISFINLCLQFGGVLVLLIYIILTIMISPMLSFIQTYLGAYSGRTYLNIWDIVPVFRGVAISVTLYNLHKVCEEFIVGALFLIFGYKTFSKLPWKKEPWDNNLCIKNQSYVSTSVIELPSFLYLRNEVFGDNGDLFGEIRLNLLIYTCVVWGFIVLVMAVKFRRYRYILQRIFPLIALISLFIFYMKSVWCNEYPQQLIIRPGLENIFDSSVWLRILSLVLYEDVPSHWITLGSFFQRRVNFIQIICFVYFVKVIAAAFLLTWIPFIGSALQNIYKIEDASCIRFTGIYLFTIMVPDSFTNVSTGNFFYFIYYISLCFWCISNITINIKITAIAMLEVWPVIRPQHNFLHLFMSSIIFGTSAPFCRSSLSELIFDLANITHYNTRSVIFFSFMISICLYNVNQFNTDWYFIYGTPFPSMTSLKIMLLTAFIFVLFYLYDMINSGFKGYFFYYIVATVILLPIFAAAVLTLGKAKNRLKVFRMKPTWGPKSNEDKVARKVFFIDMMFKYRFNLECDHNCLRNNEKLQKLMENPEFDDKQHVD